MTILSRNQEKAHHSSGVLFLLIIHLDSTYESTHQCDFRIGQIRLFQKSTLVFYTRLTVVLILYESVLWLCLSLVELLLFGS